MNREITPHSSDLRHGEVEAFPICAVDAWDCWGMYVDMFSFG